MQEGCNMKIIGISGKMGSGKSTLAKHIMNKYEDVVVEKVAADLYAIQDFIYKRTGLTMVGEKDRDLLIAIGMWGRGKSSSLWTDSCFNRVSKLTNNVVIIDDIRFPEEALAVERLGGLLVRLEGAQRGDNVDPKSFTNSSECALDNWDFKHIISNLGTQEETIEKLELILNSEV
jgi:ABC-type dipeptide/oligopeptide/nickel transport system ATPase component